MAARWLDTCERLLKLAARPGTPGEGQAAWGRFKAVFHGHELDFGAKWLLELAEYRVCMELYEGVKVAPEPEPEPAREQYRRKAWYREYEDSRATDQPFTEADYRAWKAGANYTRDASGEYVNRAREVEVVCAYCGRHATVHQKYAGNPPAYCSPSCKEMARNEAAAERMRRRRAARA